MTTNNAVNVGLSGATGTGNFVGSTSPTLVTPALGTPSSGNLSNCTNLPAAALPSGTLFNFQQGQLTTSNSSSNASFTNITGMTVTITPTSASNSVLVRAVLTVSTDVSNPSFFRLARGGTAIGVGTSVGSRTATGSEIFNATATTMSPMVLEWLDSPATTSATTYTVQCQTGGTTYINQSATDTNNSAFGRGVSTISVCEVHA